MWESIFDNDMSLLMNSKIQINELQATIDDQNKRLSTQSRTIRILMDKLDEEKLKNSASFADQIKFSQQNLNKFINDKK